MLLLIVTYIVYRFTRIEYFPEHLNGNYEVKDVVKSGTIIQTDKQRVLLNGLHDFHKGDVLRVVADVKDSRVFSHDSFINYLRSLRVTGTIKYPKEIHLISLKDDFRQRFSNYIQTGNYLYEKYAPLLLLGVKNSFNDSVYSLTKHLAITHLFVISGFHTALIIKCIS